jgi:hypothetical protein
MGNIDHEKQMLEAMLGTTVSKTAGVQVAVDDVPPISLPMNSIHYELYSGHVELHIESDSYGALIDYLKRHLPENETAGSVTHSFTKYAYKLNRTIKGWKDVPELGQALLELRAIVKPVVLAYCEQCVEDYELTNTLAQYYETLKISQPYHINVIDELHANENAHTRILTQLLKYKEEGQYQILQSFIRLFPGFDASAFQLHRAKVYFNRDFIDGLIEREGEFAIIIENKINWAVDQDKQIERYVKTECERGIPTKNIWVIYLTSDGNKKVESYSLTDETKKLLGDRFVELDYRHHILPWLKEQVLPSCRVREEWLISAIKQYVDHLEGLFGLRESQRSLQKKMQTKIAASIGCTDTMPNGEAYKRMQSFLDRLNMMQSITNNYINNLVRPTVNRLTTVTTKVFEELLPDEEISFNNAIQNNFIQVLLNKWPSAVHFEWIPMNQDLLLSGTSYRLVLHVEDSALANKLTEQLEQNSSNDCGLKKFERTTFYKKSMKAPRSMAEMTDTELTEFLKTMYADVAKVVKLVDMYLFNKQ